MKFLFSYSDGHGVNGHDVSEFLRERLAKNMESTFKKEKLGPNSTNLDLFLKEIFIRTNQDVKKEVMSSVKFSGSTCISVIYTDKKLICSNIGDSRAVMGRCSDKGIKSSKINKNFYFFKFLINLNRMDLLRTKHRP